MAYISLIALQLAGLTHRQMREIFRIFGDEAFEESILQKIEWPLLRSFGIEDEKSQKILTKISEISLSRLRGIVERNGIQTITLADSLYPGLLQELPRAPLFLSVRGNAPWNRPLLVVIGSRKHSNYSEQILRTWLPPLIEQGIGIISGGAYGVDALAHKITLENWGYTAAVVGTGIDRVYPSEHRKLFDDIVASGGAIISHFPLGAEAEPFHFPIRNELKAGMSHGVLVTEAREKSGALITAKYALDFGRDVYALPWDVTRHFSEGTNGLLKRWEAQAVTQWQDLLTSFPSLQWATATPESVLTKDPEMSDPLHALIFSYLKKTPATPDILAVWVDREILEITRALSMMEILGLTRRDFEGKYSV